MAEPRRLLVIGPSNIGDAMLMSEVIARLSARYPQAHLALVVGTRATVVFTDDPRVHTLVDSETYGSGLGRVKLAIALWRYRPDLVVDLRHTAYPLLLQPQHAWRYLQMPPRRLSHMRDRNMWKLAQQAPGIGQRVGAAPGGQADTLWYSARDRTHVDQLWTRWRLNGKPLIVICPGARSHIKRWTAEGFAQVADGLITELGAEVLFSGESDEKPVIEEIAGLMRAPVRSAVGLLTIRQLALVMQRAQLVITNDSASLHVASAVGTPTLAIFGPTDETQYGPTASPHRVLRRRLICAPCRQALCRFNHECMRFISAREALDAARALLTEAA